MSRLQHAQMLVVRKEGKAHARYNSFRSAFELLEAVGREPHDVFEERNEDLPPLEKLDRRMQQWMHETRQQQHETRQQQHKMQQQIHEMQQQIHELRVENEALKLGVEKKPTKSIEEQLKPFF